MAQPLPPLHDRLVSVKEQVQRKKARQAINRGDNNAPAVVAQPRQQIPIGHNVGHNKTIEERFVSL